MNKRSTDITGAALPAGFEEELKKPSTKPALVLQINLNGDGATMVTIDPSRITSFTLDDALEGSNGYACLNTASFTLDNFDKCFSPQRFTVAYDPATLQYNGPRQGDGRGNLRPWRKMHAGFTIPQFPGVEVPLIDGYVDGNGFREKIGADNQNEVFFKVNDLGKKLLDLKTPGGEVTPAGATVPVDKVVGISGKKICDPADTNNSIVHILANVYGGIPLGKIITPQTMNIVVDYFILDKDPWTELALLADAVKGLVLFNGDELYFGDSPFFAGVQNTQAIAFTNDHYSGLDIQENFDSIKNKIKVTYGSYKKLGNQTLWMFNNTDPISGLVNPPFSFDPSAASRSPASPM